MLTIISSILIPLLKWIFSRIAKKKLNDKEFVEYVLAHQKKKVRAGHAAMDWEKALKAAQMEMAESAIKQGKV